MTEYPSEGDLVICRIKSIENYGVFVDLVEYEKEGFIHISKITSGWVKNIRSHVSEGQLRVASVVKVDKQKDLIDLSMRKVGPVQEREKMAEWKRYKHAIKVFKRICGSINEDYEKAAKDIMPKLQLEYGDLYSALEACVLEDKDALKNIKISEKWKKAIIEQAKSSISPPSVNIKGTLTLQFFSPNGAETLRALGKEVNTDNIQLSYISAPDYSLIVTSSDYNKAESLLDETLKKVEKTVNANKGKFSFKRE